MSVRTRHSCASPTESVWTQRVRSCVIVMPALCPPGIHQAVRVRTHIFSHRCILLWFVLILSGAVLIFIWCLGKINLLLCWKPQCLAAQERVRERKGLCVKWVSHMSQCYFSSGGTCVCAPGAQWGARVVLNAPSNSKMGRRKCLSWMSRQSKIYYIKWPTQNQCVCAGFFRCRWMCGWQQMCKWYLFKHRGFVSLPLWCRLPPRANQSDVPG